MSTPIDQLLEESRELERRARGIQGEFALRASEEELDQLVSDYHEWFGRGIQLLPDELKERFRFEYEGNFFQNRIKHFFEAPGAKSSVYNEETAQLGMAFWAHPFETEFRSPLLKQRQILVEAKQEIQGEDGSHLHLDLVERLVRRLPDFLVVLRNRQRQRPSFVVEDEYDLQDILHAVLKLHFEDVRAEDFASEHAGGRSRIDFVLKAERLVIEAKMTRSGLGPREVGDQLILDIERYRTHPDCGALIAVVYDPEQRIVNPRTLESDLSGIRDGLTVRVVVFR